MRRLPATVIAIVLLVAWGRVLAQGDSLSGLSHLTPLQLDVANDACLAKRISYDSGYKRLHDVAKDLTGISGVTVLSGGAEDDWHIRDIPLVVCVKDMPLGKLLQAIADATHCCCVQEEAGGDCAKSSYRIYRGKAEQAKIDSYLAQTCEAKIAEAKWVWDAMVAFGQRSAPPQGDLWQWHVSRLISTLDEDAKNRLFGGEAILIRGNDPARRQVMAQLYKLVWQDVPQYVHLQDQPTEAEIDSATLAIELRNPGYYRNIGVYVTVYPVIHGEKEDYWTSGISPYTLKKYSDSSFPRYPQQADWTAPPEKLDRPGTTPRHSTAEWDRPYLNAKFDLDPPADARTSTFADFVRSTALAGGCNIVAEDFMSNLDPGYAPIHAVFRKDTSIREALKSLVSLVNERGYTWFANDSEKLLLGWAHDGFRTHWQQCHAGLVPEAYVNGLRSKYNGSGLEMDDFMHFTSMTSNKGSGSYNSADPYVMWVNHAAGLHKLYDHCIPGSGFWLMYDSLTPANKLLAKSERGCPLGGLDAAWVAKTLRKCRLGSTRLAYTPEEARLLMTVLTNPNVISTMVMYVKSAPSSRMNHHLTPRDYGVDVDYDVAVKALGLTEYQMVIRYTFDGKSREAQTSPLCLAFPVRSPEREAEMLRGIRKEERLKEKT